jgi:cysteine desulfurase
MVNPIDLECAITPETIMVTIMHANNEVGTIQPIRELAEITHQHGAYFHTDAAQSVGKVPADIGELDVDLLSIAGHKLYAPKGVGALYIRKGLELTQLMYGAGHESGRRPGTENVLEIVGLGKACQIAARDLNKIQDHFQAMRDRLHQGLLSECKTGSPRLNGHPKLRLPNTLSLSFHNIPANFLLAEINGQVAASAGSACHADQVTVSSVLEAMHVPIEWAMGTIRFSVGRGTKAEEIDRAVPIIVEAVRKRNSVA